MQVVGDEAGIAVEAADGGGDAVVGVRTDDADGEAAQAGSVSGPWPVRIRQPRVRPTQVAARYAVPRKRELYHAVEKAKRRLLFTLFSLGLPVEGRAERADGLAFRMLTDARLDGVDIDPSADEAITTALGRPHHHQPAGSRSALEGTHADGDERGLSNAVRTLPPRVGALLLTVVGRARSERVSASVWRRAQVLPGVSGHSEP